MNKNVPLYITVMEVIKEKIINGIYKIGDFIPTENELEKEFNVSKITIRKAIELLEGEGYVSKRSGKGTTVVSNSIFNRLSKGESFSSILNKEGFKLRKEKTLIEEIEILPQDELYNVFGNRCKKIRRLYYLDGKPYIHFVHYLPCKIKIEVSERENDFSIYMQMYKSGIFINRFHDEFFIDYPEIKIIESLDIKEGPLLGRKRITYDKDDNIIEVSIAQYNTRIHNYVVNYYI
ncbi:MAG: GntR family transcriptional regulator [Clostridium chrysemydis]|uniref:GntR family transcriptional regulator n=1 Tax=Clostridium chrysemydis TaxID=2665504 RepID=UPI003F31BBB3